MRRLAKKTIISAAVVLLSASVAFAQEQVGQVDEDGQDAAGQRPAQHGQRTRDADRGDDQDLEGHAARVHEWRRQDRVDIRGSGGILIPVSNTLLAQALPAPRLHAVLP